MTTLRPAGAGQFPLVDEGMARALHLGAATEVLFRVNDASGSALVTKRPFLRHEATTARAVAAAAVASGGTSTEERWRWYQALTIGDDSAARALRVVPDWRDGVPLLIEVAGPDGAAAERELEVLTRHFGPQQPAGPLRVVARALLWVGAALAVWLSAMRILQSTPVAGGVAVAMYAATALGLVLLAAQVARNALPPRRPANLFHPAALRRAIGWSWLAPATVLVLRAPVEPYVEWLPGWWAAAAAALLYAVAALGPAPVRLPRTRGREAPPGWQALDPAGLGLGLGLPVPDSAWACEGGTAACWHARVHLPLEGIRWNQTTTSWDSPAGTVTAQRFDTWDGAPVAVVVARSVDRTLLLRQRDSAKALPQARALADQLFPGGDTVAEPVPGAAARWAPAILAWWVCLMTIAVGSDLGPSHYEWYWPQDVLVEHHYPVLGALAVLTVALAWGWTAWALFGLLADGLTGRAFRRAARQLAWQVAAVWAAAEILTLTLLGAFAEQPAALRVTELVAVANLAALAAGLLFLLLVRPENAVGLPRRARS